MPAEKLNARKVDAIKKPGRYSDGRNLYLQVTPSGGKSWALLYTLNGRHRQMGLGALEFLPLADAREAALEARKLIRRGVDPLDARRAATVKAVVPTFGDVEAETLKRMKAQWTSPRSASQWEASMRDYVLPHLKDRPVDTITVHDIRTILEPIWTTKHETATRVRERVQKVLDRATAEELRQGPNPARWRGNLDHLLPDVGSRDAKNHESLFYGDVQAFLTALRLREGIAARALEFTVLTGARTSETIGARWSEIDLDNAVWCVPKERMKMRRPHRVPLSPTVVALLKALPRATKHDLVFIGQSKNGGLSGGGMERVLDRMGVKVTVHGFRSTFRKWAGGTTAYPREVIEMALAHSVANPTEAAYLRDEDYLDKRRPLMEAWAAFCAMPPRANGENVVPMRAGTDG